MEQDEFEPEIPSKSARKRDAAALQDLGVALAAMAPEVLAELDLPEVLIQALRELRRLKSHGAALRQRQYIGKIMRKIDVEPIRAKLAQRREAHDAAARRLSRLPR
jgi:ribosome-associated protein